jgi:hypothetical protein
MPSKRPHTKGPIDRKPKQDPETKAEKRRGVHPHYEERPEAEHTQNADAGKLSPVEIDADSSRGDPPHGYGTEAPQVQGGGKR